MQKRSLSQLVRIICSFVLLMMIFSSLYYIGSLVQSQEEMRAQQIRHYDTALHQMRDRIDNTFFELWKIVSVVESKERLRPAAIKDGGVLSLMRARDELKDLQFTNLLLYDIGLYPRSEGFLITPNGIYNQDAIRGVIPQYDQLPPKTLLEILEDPIAHMRRIPLVHGLDTLRQKNNSPSSVVTLFYPIPYTSRSPYATLMLKLDGKQLLSIIGGLNVGEAAFVVDSEGQVILWTQSAPEALSAHAVQAPNPARGEFLDLDQGQYYRFSLESGRMPYRYHLYIPSAQIDSSRFASALTRSFFAMVCTCLLLLLCAILLRWMYSPMSRLIRDANAIQPPSASLFFDETSHIREVIGNLSRQNGVLHRQIVENISDARQAVINNLVSHQYERLEEVLNACERIGLKLSHPHFTVVLIELSSPGRPSQSAIVTPETELYFVKDSRRGPNTLLGVASFAAPDGRLLARQTGSFLDALEDPRPEVCTGNWTNSILSLNAAYQGAVESLGQKKRRCAQAEAAMRPGGPLNYPIDIMYHLRYSLLSQNRERAVKYLDRLTGFLEENPADSVVSIVLKDASDAIRDSVGLRIGENGRPDAFSREALLELLEQTRGHLTNKSAPGAEHNVVIGQILEYIDAHLEDPDFSARRVSDQFGMKESTFSHMFKRCMNRSFTHHVNELKIRRAQNLLLNTGMSVEEIAVRLGYSSSSNFGRMFKAAVQLTPIQYRIYAAELANWEDGDLPGQSPLYA